MMFLVFGALSSDGSELRACLTFRVWQYMAQYGTEQL